MIVDTDILSQLAKVGKVTLLHQICGEGNVRISLEVYQELIVARERGLFFVSSILKERFQVVFLDNDLMDEYQKNLLELKKIHAGELSSILLCRKFHEPFLSNDKQAHHLCDSLNVTWLDICDLLSLAYLKEIFQKRIFLILSEISKRKIIQEY